MTDRRGLGTDDARGASLRPSHGPLDRIQHALHRYPVLSPTFVLLVSCVVFTLFGDGRFQRPETIGIILQQTAVLATLAIGQTLIILTAGVDLVGRDGDAAYPPGRGEDGRRPGGARRSSPCCSASSSASRSARFHGVLVTRIGLPPFIVTLGTFYIFNSLGLVYSKAQTISNEAIGGERLAAAVDRQGHLDRRRCGSPPVCSSPWRCT